MYTKNILLLFSCFIPFLLRGMERAYEPRSRHEQCVANHEGLHKETSRALQQYIQENGDLDYSALQHVMHEDMALINDMKKKAAIVLFEIPDKPPLYRLSREEIARARALLNVYQIENRGKYKAISFCYNYGVLLPENHAQALYLLYSPYVENASTRDDMSPRSLQEYHSQVSPPLNEIQAQAFTLSEAKMEAFLQDAENHAKARNIVSNHLKERLELDGNKEGFFGSTIVRTDKGYRKIEDLKVGDTVACYNGKDSATTYSKVTFADRLQVSKHIRIVMDGGVIHVAHDHKFYAKSSDSWVTAHELLTTPDLRRLVESRMQDVKEVNQPLEVVRITVDEHHNFYVTPHNILVHNYIPVVFEVAVAWGGAEGVIITWGILAPTLIAATCGVQYWFYNSIIGPPLPIEKAPVSEVIFSQNPAIPQHLLPLQNNSAETGMLTQAPRISEGAVQANTLQPPVSDVLYDPRDRSDKKLPANPSLKSPAGGGGTPSSPQKPDDKDKHPHGKYGDADYHHKNSQGPKSPAPQDGQKALDNSMQIKKGSPHRIAIEQGKFVVLNQTQPGLYHGHVRSWEQLRPAMQRALQKAGKVTLSGKII